MEHYSPSSREHETQQRYIEALRAWNDAHVAGGHARRRAFVLTFGCQQNEADSEKFRGTAQAMGYELTAQPQDASLIVVNTCAIREHAELKALSTIGQYKHIKATNPALVIAVCGCMPAQESRRNELKNKYPYVDLVFGTTSAHRFPELLHQKLESGRRLFAPEDPTGVVYEGTPVVRESSYRAWVSIMYGCNNFCSYCIVPYVRGRERSRLPQDVIAEVRSLIADGYRDITLLGQNVNSYGKDLDGDYDFADLLRDISAIEGDYLLHFMSSHPKDATHKLIDVMAECPHIAPHFHLPLQSGSDRVLRAMNRHYDTAKYWDTVRYMRARIPHIALTSDIIVGFPGETEQDFEQTLDMLRGVRFDMLYSFIFSPRKGTPADTMPDAVPDKVKSERFSRLLAVQNDISLDKNRPFEGCVARVLCDGLSKTNDALCQGRTDGGKMVFFACDPARMGTYVTVRIDRADSYALYGTLVE